MLNFSRTRLVVVSVLTCVIVAAMIKALISDREKTASLYNVQDSIVAYWLDKKELPDALAQADVSYKKISNVEFKLCTTFLLPSIPGHALGSAENSTNPFGERMLDPRYPDLVLYEFEHAKGDVCFTRVLKPELIRLNSKQN
jgi:hypothetical protein